MTKLRLPTSSRRTPNTPNKAVGGRARAVAQRKLNESKQLSSSSSVLTHEHSDKPIIYKKEPSDFKRIRGRHQYQGDFKDRHRVTKHHSQEKSVSSQANKPQTVNAQKKNHDFNLFATCPKGIEEILANELDTLGFKQVRKGKSGCYFSGDMADMMRANLHSRLATRILLEVGQATVYDETELYEFAYQTPWENWFGPEHTLRIDTSAISSPMKSLQFCNLKVKDAICDRLRDKEGSRPNIDTVRPDAKVQLFLQEHQATLYLDTSGESLFKRGWRLDKGEAPLRENLAAALLVLSGWDKQSPLFDPFCGSATLLIEAVYMAQNVPPGLLRMFGFSRYRHFDKGLWEYILEEGSAQITTPLDVPLFGSDINPHIIQAALENQDRARLSPHTIQFSVQDALNSPLPTSEKGWIVTNPPYGQRLEVDDSQLWRSWSSLLKKQYTDWHIHIISSDLDLPSKLRLRPKRRIPIHNGALDCRLFSFDMVEGKHE
ncbi:THUMP domain-containing class I SAM-dependent RNA methyltransferase [Basilea psittacipulmonis]|uniref:THUMP domain-containing class I SAM-dependent RNA methyltransferase n=1 Tax=Basilea psittacipulmonis TaxID=1472345 RepID=UPI000689414D|nr:THUMP domain-containing protein [Basilea psittacipulmonis]